MIIFWGCFHSIMFLILVVIRMLTEIASAWKEIRNSEKHAKDRKEHYIGEMIMMMIIILVVVIIFLFIVLDIIMKNQTMAVWFCAVSGTAYVYLAVKQTIKMIFIPEKRVFSFSDIKDFTYTYMVWWIMVLAVISIELGDSTLDKLTLTYGELVKIGIFFFWYYLNILYALGSLYIFLYYLWKIWEKLAKVFIFKDKKIKDIVNRICDSWKQGEKYVELRSYRLWKEGNKNSVVYKVFMTIPLLIFDICKIIHSLAKTFIKVTVIWVVALIFDPIRLLYKYVKNIWNRYKNNEWMYLFAQISGLSSFVIVFLIIQYGEYEETTKKIYEFVGTVILIPYFISKIASVNKSLKEDRFEVNSEREKGHCIPENYKER